MAVEVWLYEGTQYGVLTVSTVNVVFEDDNTLTTIASFTNAAFQSRDKAGKSIVGFGGELKIHPRPASASVYAYDFGGNFSPGTMHSFYVGMVSQVHLVLFPLPPSISMQGPAPQSIDEVPSFLDGLAALTAQERRGIWTLTRFVQDNKNAKNRDIRMLVDHSLTTLWKLGIKPSIFD